MQRLDHSTQPAIGQRDSREGEGPEREENPVAYAHLEAKEIGVTEKELTTP